MLYTSFSDIGFQKSEQELNQQSNTEDLKPFTTKVPSYVLESIDLLATKMGIPRNTLMNVLINQFLAWSFFDFVEGYNSPFTHPGDYSDEEQAKLELTELLNDPSISLEAKEYLETGLHNLLIKFMHVTSVPNDL